jgi:hypothetical protein
MGRLARQFGCLLTVCALVTSCGPPASGPDGDADRARQLIADGQYVEAVSIARQNLARVESATGVDTLAAAEALDVLVMGLVYGSRTDIEEAHALAQRALQIKEVRLEADDPSLATTLIGTSMMASGDLASGGSLLEESIAG